MVVQKAERSISHWVEHLAGSSVGKWAVAKVDSKAVLSAVERAD